MTTLSVTTPTARKAHRCWYCATLIMPGEQYVRQTGVYPDAGGFQTIAIHQECNSVWQEMYRDGTLMTDDGLDYGMFKRGSRCEKHCDCSKCTPVTKSTEG